MQQKEKETTPGTPPKELLHENFSDFDWSSGLGSAGSSIQTLEDDNSSDEETYFETDSFEVSQRGCDLSGGVTFFSLYSPPTSPNAPPPSGCQILRQVVWQKKKLSVLPTA